MCDKHGIMVLADNDVFHVLNKLDEHNMVSRRWVYKFWRNSSGQVYHHKARLVAKGYSHVQDVDYEVYASMVTLSIISCRIKRHGTKAIRREDCMITLNIRGSHSHVSSDNS